MVAAWGLSYSTIALLSAVAFAAVSSPQGFAVGQAIKTTSGTYKGHPSKTRPNVSEYLGIKYGKPPVGALRFKNPEPYHASENFLADKWGDDCPGAMSSLAPGTTMATIASILTPNTTTVSEDCLNLNIWTKPQTGDKAKAVLVWLYGGGFALGSAKTLLYDGSILADEEDVIIVTIDYRLSIFGYPAGPDGSVDQNPGLVDQRLATEWMRDNIGAFGGDTKRITLLGESAGGGSTDMYAYAWADAKDPIINGFIPQSGSALGSDMGMGKTPWFGVSKAVGCGDAKAGIATVACMQTKDWKVIIEASRMSVFFPRPDGKVVFNDYPARLTAGKFIKKPIFIGNNDNEGGFQKVFLQFMNISNTYKPMLNSLFDMIGAPMGKMMGCGAASAAAGRIAQGVPAWRYRYMAVFPNSQIVADAGAVHGAEISLVWGTMANTPTASNIPNTPDEEGLSKEMRHIWTQFAKDPINGLTKLGYPQYDGKKDTLMRIGNQNKNAVDLVQGDMYDKSCTDSKLSPFSLSGLLSKLGGKISPAKRT